MRLILICLFVVVLTSIASAQEEALWNAARKGDAELKQEFSRRELTSTRQLVTV